MANPLREVLALLQTKVTGTEAITRANAQIDALKATAIKPITFHVQEDLFGDAGRRAFLKGKRQQAELAETSAASAARVRGSWLAAGSAVGIAAVGIFAAIRGVIMPVASMIQEVITLGDELESTAGSIGISTTELQRWRFVAERGNVDAELLVGSMSRLQRTAFSSPKSFRGLGVALRGANGQVKPANELFRETGIALARIEDPAERAARAQQIFGRQGRALLPIFADGEEGLEAMIRRFDELGGGLSEDVIAAAAGADDAMVDWRLSMTSLKGVLATSVLPVITRLVTGGAELIAKLSDLVRHSSIVEATLIGLAAVAAVVAAAMLAFGFPVIVAAVALAALVLVVEDVITAFRGGESVFGSFVEWLAEAMGLSLTFSGLLESAGVVWDEFAARVLGAVASIVGGLNDLRRAMGLPDLSGIGDAATDLRGRAAAARTEADASANELWENEQRRRADRAAILQERLNAPATAIVKSGKPRGERRRGRGREGGVHVEHRPTYQIQSNDPAGVRREIEAHEQRRLRELQDILPILEPEGA